MSNAASKTLKTGVTKSVNLRNNLLYSHMWVAFVGVIILVISSGATLWLRQHAINLAVVNNPMTLALSTLQQSIKNSDGFLRDSVIFEDEIYSDLRRIMWKNKIYPALDELANLSKKDTTSQLNLIELESSLRDIELWQWHVEDVVRTPGNMPAQVFLDSQLIPIANRVFYSVKNLIDQELKYIVVPDEDVNLKAFVNLSSNLHQAHSNVIQYIETGKKIGLSLYKSNYHRAVKDFVTIHNNKELLTQHQLVQYNNLLSSFGIYKKLAKKAIKIRGSNQWNVSDDWFESKLIPLTNEVLLQLEEQSFLESSRAEQVASQISTISKYLPWLLIGLMGLMIYIAFHLAKKGSDQFIAPVIILEEQDKLKDYLSKFASEIEDAINISDLGEKIIHVLAKQTGALSGALYIVEDDVLKRKASYALAENANMGVIKRGEGIAGQVWVDKEPIELKASANQDFTIQTTMMDMTPKSVMIFPVLHDDKVIAIIELATLAEFTDIDKNYLDKGTRQIAVQLHSVQQKETIQIALEESQALSEELQSQQEELRITNEKLLIQSEDLEKQKKNLVKANVTLSEKSEDLTSQAKVLEKARLETHQKAEELEEASRYKSEFLANMSHELRTPLNSLLILSRSLADNDEGNLTEDDVESAQVIQDSGNHLLNLINEILDISKVEAGQMIADKESFDLNEVCQVINNRFKHMAEDKGIAFEFSLAPDAVVEMVSDRAKIEQILTNLISNAIKFTDKGKVVLSITSDRVASTENDGNPQVITSFAVKDDGIGIAENKLSKVFEAFKQADGSTSRTHGGTGLGLSIAKSFSELLGGDISLQSVINEGSIFTLEIPNILSDKGNAQADSNQSTEEDTVVVEMPAQQNHIPTNDIINNMPLFKDDRSQLDSNKSLMLIIEDDSKFSKILFSACHKQGCQAIVAPDGETGITLAGQYKDSISGIILDYMLPGRDGADVLNALKFSEDTKYIPVHMVTALDDIDDMCKLGAIGQITKPVNSQQIKSIIDQLRSGDKKGELTLLMIDDDSEARQLTSKFMNDNKVNLKEAKNAEQALSIIKESKLDGIILDIGLPDMSAIELLEKVNEIAGLTLPPVIVYTERVLSDEEQIRFEPFVESVIVKSVRSHERLLEDIHLFAGHMSRNTNSDESDVIRKNDENANLEGKSVLLVDDDMRNTFALAKVLRKRGLQVYLAPSGKDALVQLDTVDDIEIVLMDIMMPEMDGYETMKHIRDQDKFKKLPVIALTANAMKGDEEKCIAAGANDYMSKPVDVDNLIHLMRMWA